MEQLETRLLLTATAIAPSFGQDGVAVTDGFQGSNTSDTLVKVLELANGKLMSIGNTTVDPANPQSASGVSVTLHDSNGTLDSTFANAGKAFEVLDFTVHDALLQSDGGVIVVGGTQNSMMLARLLANGSLDGSFGNQGVMQVSIVQTAFGAAQATVLDADNGILLVGTAQGPSGTADLAVVRVQSNGALDSNFGTNGVAMINFSSLTGLTDGEETGLTVAIDSQERIVVGGVSDIEGFALARLTNTGSLDSTFGGDGRVSVNVPLMEEVDLSIAVDGQDQTYVVGTVTNLLGASSYHVTRLLESGETDVNYAVDGALQGVLSLLDTATTEIAPPVLDAAGNLLMVYSVDDALTLLQVDSTGTPDVNLDVDGLLTLDTSPTELKVTDVLLDQAGNLVLGGVSSTLETLADFLLVRLQEPSGDPVNDPPLEAPPVATDDLLNTTERALLTGNLITDDNGQGIDLDEHPQTLVVSAVNGIAAKVGATTWLSSGSKVVVNADGSFTYDPNGRFDRVNYEEVVVESFTYTLKDDSGLESTATVTVRVHGEDDGFTFSGSTLQVNGGVGGDVLRYNAQFGRITLNGLHASLGDDIVLVTIDGHDGDDRITVLGTLGDDQFQLHPNRLVMEHDSTHTGYELVVVNVEAATLFGQGGADSGNLFDSHGDDRIVCRPNGVALIGGGSSREMIGFGQVRAVATLGYDRVLLVGGDAVDRLIVRPDVTVFQCGDRQLSLEGFNLIVSRAPGAGDEVQFHGSEAGDALRGRPGLAVFSVDGVNVHAEGFELVSANGAGGADRAMLFGDQGDDSLAVTPNSAVFLSGGVQFNTQSFDKLIVRAGQGGNDVATLVDSNGDDLFVGEEDRAHLQGLGFNSLAERFHVVRLRGINGGFNRLTLADPLQFELLQQGSWN